MKEVLVKDYLTIHECLKAARAGEKVAWNTVYQHYYPGLYSIAIQICNNIPMAQDMVQDTFITAYLKLGQLKNIDAFSGWIKKILIHTCYRASRRNQPSQLLNKVSQKTDSWWEDELNKKLDWISTKSNLYTSLADLPEVLRSTMLLRYFSAFQSYEEIASILSVPIGTVRSRLNQAKLKLTEQWKRSNDADPKILQKGEALNSFYQGAFSGMHQDDNYKNQFIDHLHKDVQIVPPGGRPARNSSLFEKMIDDDREAGSWLTPVNVMSSGNISIVEVKHFNSSEHPHHCPAGSVMILYRSLAKVSKIQLQVFGQ